MIAKILSVFVFSNDPALATWHIRLKLQDRYPGRTVLYHLKKMEKLGIVKRSRYTTVNNIVWELTKREYNNQEDGMSRFYTEEELVASEKEPT